MAGGVVFGSEEEVVSLSSVSVSGSHLHVYVGISDEELYSLYVVLGEFGPASPPQTLQIVAPTWSLQ